MVNRDDAVGIHFSQTEVTIQPELIPRLYIFVNDVDTLYEEYLKSGVKIVEPIEDMDYKMREFVIEDLNGYKIVIGKGINS